MKNGNNAKICLDLHDFSVVHNRLELLLKLKERYPNFKVSLFTVPCDTKYDFGNSLVREDSLQKIKENLNWLQLIPHGLTHNGSEMRNCSYETFKYKIMPAIKEAFHKDGLPFKEGFCAPHWRWSEGVVKALDEAGWWGAIDRRQPKMLSTKKFYRYSHCLDEPFTDGEILKLHGHVYGTSNDLGKCFENLMKLPKDAEWHFATDFLEEKT